MASKQSKHQATTGSHSRDGIRKPVRLTILAVIYTLFLAVAIAFHMRRKACSDLWKTLHASAYGRCVFCCA